MSKLTINPWIQELTLLSSLCFALIASLTGCATPLMSAAGRGDLATVKNLVESGVDVNEKSAADIGRNALSLAAGSGHVQVVKYLLDNGADVNMRDARGYTPLFWAALHDQIGTCQLLLERGADPGVAGRFGTPRKAAEKNGNTSIAEMLKEAEEKWYPTATKTTSVQSAPTVAVQTGKTPGIDEGVISDQWAVIIGISKYQHSGSQGLPNLIFADDDAKVFAHTLQKLGWSDSHVKILINETATRRNIMIALESWLTKAGPNDRIVLFWAGHGFPDPEDPDKVYFACYDTDINIPATGYRMDRVRDALEERNAKNVIIFADTCHAGKIITRGGRGISVVPEIEKLRRERKIPKGWIFMVGADTDRQAIEHTSWKNGAFTHCLINGLSGEADGYESVDVKDGIVTMKELRAFMNTAMPGETQRVLGTAKRPVITTSTGDPDIWNMSLQAD